MTSNNVLFEMRFYAEATSQTKWKAWLNFFQRIKFQYSRCKI